MLQGEQAYSQAPVLPADVACPLPTHPAAVIAAWYGALLMSQFKWFTCPRTVGGPHGAAGHLRLLCPLCPLCLPLGACAVTLGHTRARAPWGASSWRAAPLRLSASASLQRQGSAGASLSPAAATGLQAPCCPPAATREALSLHACSRLSPFPLLPAGTLLARVP